MTDPTAPGPDEVRVRQLLVKAGVGPDGDPDTPSPEEPPEEPSERPRDWLDDILDTPAGPAEAEPGEKPEPEEAPAEPTPPKTSGKKTSKRSKARQSKRQKAPHGKPAAPRSAWDSAPASPRQSLAEAWDRVPYRLKWLAYHASAAYLGWSAGIVGWSTRTTAWIAATGFVGVQAFVCYAAAACTFLLYRRTRGWWLPVAWLAAVPAASTVVGVLLYAPTQ